MLAVCGDYMPPLHIKDPTAADILPWLIDAMTNTVDSRRGLATDYWIDGWSFVWEGKAVGRGLPAQESYDEAHQQNTQPLHYLPAGTNILALLFGSSNFSRLHNTPSYLVFKVMIEQKIGSLFENKLTNSRLLVCANVQWVDLSSNSMSVRTGNCCWRLADSV